MSVVPWATLAEEEPELAAAGEELLRSFTLGYLATIRSDGSPRIQPVTVTLHHGGLYVFVIDSTPKARDLAADRRYALHSFPRFPSGGSFDDEELSLSGAAVPIVSAATRDAVAAVHNDSVSDSHTLYRLDVDRALHKRRVGGEPVYRRWRASISRARSSSSVQ